MEHTGTNNVTKKEWYTKYIKMIQKEDKRSEPFWPQALLIIADGHCLEEKLGLWSRICQILLMEVAAQGIPC